MRDTKWFFFVGQVKLEKLSSTSVPQEGVNVLIHFLLPVKRIFDLIVATIDCQPNCDCSTPPYFKLVVF